MPNLSRRLATPLAVALSISLAPITRADEAETLRWLMNSLLHPVLFGEAGRRFAETVERLSGGEFAIEVRDRMVLDQDAFGALDAGLVDAVWGSAGHHHREDPALTLFSGFPFGPDPAGFAAWMTTGGGAHALGAIYARHGLKSLFCGVLPAEGGGWFREPVDGANDLDGLAMRSFGYGARTLRKLGAVPYELPAEEIRPALDIGLIDAAEFSLPSIDAELSVAEVARHLYFPGWQQPATSLEILMTLKTWTALPDRRRAILEAACADVLSWTAVEGAARQVAALAAFRAQGVVFHAWPEETLRALRRAWEAVIAEETAREPLLAEDWAGYQRFREGHEDWRKRAYPETPDQPGIPARRNPSSTMARP